MAYNERPQMPSDHVYFCDNACLSSFAGIVDNGSILTEETISGWIRGTHPALYKKLAAMPRTSCSLVGDPPTPIYPEPYPAEQFELPMRGSVPFFRPLTPPTPATIFDESGDNDSPTEDTSTFVLDTLQSKVIGNTIFTLHQYPRHGEVFCCSCPTCRHQFNLIPGDEYFGAVRFDPSIDNDVDPAIETAIDFYCLECFESVIQTYHNTQAANHGSTPDLPGTVDGAVKQKHVLETAEKLHSPLKLKDLWKMYLPSEPPLKAGTMSNSKHALRLRRQKQYEIVRILQEVRGDELTAMATADTSKPGNLLLVRPRNLPQFRNRYKKQGREWTDRTLHEKYSSIREGNALPVVTESSKPPVVDYDLSCYCREPPESAFMIRCNSDTCMFGQIHFRCTGLDQLPVDQTDFLCRYCETFKHGHLGMTAENVEKVADAESDELRSSTAEGAQTVNEVTDTIDTNHEHWDEHTERPIAPASHFVAINHSEICPEV